jgi:hypothetical protein
VIIFYLAHVSSIPFHAICSLSSLSSWSVVWVFFRKTWKPYTA